MPWTIDMLSMKFVALGTTVIDNTLYGNKTFKWPNIISVDMWKIVNIKADLLSKEEKKIITTQKSNHIWFIILEIAVGKELTYTTFTPAHVFIMYDLLN